MAVAPGLRALLQRIASIEARVPRFEWATVSDIIPHPTIVLDSDTSGTPREVTESAIGPVHPDQRVYVMIRARRLTILAAPPAVE